MNAHPWVGYELLDFSSELQSVARVFARGFVVDLEDRGFNEVGVKDRLPEHVFVGCGHASTEQFDEHGLE